MSAPLFFLDFEARSLADIKLGGRVYWQDPTTEIVCLAWQSLGGEGGVWLPGDACPFPAGARLAAHNMMGFDRFGLARIGAEPGELIDTADLARRAGLPGSLDQLAKRLLGTEKDHSGNRVTMALSLSPVTGDVHDKATGALMRRGVPEDLREDLREYQRACKAAQAWAPIPPRVLERVIAYCRSDVDVMVRAWPELADWLEVDAEVDRVQRAVNDRGVPFDVHLASRLLEEDERNKAEALRRAGEALGLAPEKVASAAKSPVQFCAIAGAYDAQADTVRRLLDSTTDPKVRAICEARQALATIAKGKLEAGLRREIDGRLYDVHRYYGGHTGRWSGSGMQLQNLPRPPKEFEDMPAEAIDRLARDVLAGRHADPGEIDLLLRATVCAPKGQLLCVCDFAGVENRALAFYAGDTGALAGIGKVDPYKVAAAEIFDVAYDDVEKWQRAVGKVAELALGYGGGANALVTMSHSYGIDLDALGVDPDAVVYAWRRLHAPVVRFWYAVERAFCSAAKGRAARVGAFEFAPAEDGSAVAIVLPSGRPIVYNAPELLSEGRRTKITFHGTKAVREYTYGGKLTENLIQAVCRDLLADALVRVERDPRAPVPVMHVHDEIVALAPREKADKMLGVLERHMLTVPEWADGFPIGAEGYVSKRYKK